MTFLLIAAMILGDAASDVLMARAMRRTSLPHGLAILAWLRVVPLVLRNPDFVFGIAGAALHFFAFLTLLAFEDLSFVIPASALVYVASTLGARFVLREHVSARRWFGIVLITAGVALVSAT